MTNASVTYHHNTSYSRHEMRGHRLDWTNRPVVYKIYRGKDYFPLPRPGDFPCVPFQYLAESLSPKTLSRQAHTIDHLSVILALTYGITGHSRMGVDNFYYRSAPSAGALYPVEIYMAIENMGGLEHGLYHYDASGHRLCRLRPENIMPFAEACIGNDTVDTTPRICFFLSAVIFRSAWKYRARAFRYLLLDTGHVLDNLLMALKAEGLSASVHYDIHRDRANKLLGFDPKREICLACVRISGGNPPGDAIPEELTALPRNIIDACRVASKEIFHREIEEMALSSSTLPIHNRRPSDMMNHLGLFPDNWQQIEPSHHPFVYHFSDAVMNRRSRRNFISNKLSKDAFLELLSFLSRTSKMAQPVAHPIDSTLSVGLLVQNIVGISSGFYLCDFSNKRWVQVREENLCSAMATACLDQQWLQNAAMHFCFLANLEQLDQYWGARGYQYAMLNAGRLGQRIYLAATALNLGSCGIGALYDNDARRLLGLNQSSALLYLVAAGPVKR